MSNADHQPTPQNEWALLEVEHDCLKATAKRRFFEEAEAGRSGWHDREARYHVYKAHDQLSVASYHSRQDNADEVVKTNLADCLNHILMAMATMDVDHDGCQPVTPEEVGRDGP